MRAVYRKSTHIIVASPGFKKRLVEKGLSPEKITFVPNNADETVYYPVSKDPALRARFNLEPKDIVLLYAGNIGEPQRLDIAIQAMQLLRHRVEIKLMIVGDGSCKQSLVDTCVQGNVNSVIFVNRVLPDQMNEFYAMADALLMQLDDNPIWNDTIPSKIYAYMLVNRPVIAALKGDGADIIIDSNGGVICDPGSASSLARAIESFADMPFEQRESMGARNRDYVIKHFSRDVAVDLINDILVKFAPSA